MYFLWQQRERPTHFWLHLYLIFIHSSVDELVLCMSPRADANRKQASRKTDGKPATLSEQQKEGWGVGGQMKNMCEIAMALMTPRRWNGLHVKLS